MSYQLRIYQVREGMMDEFLSLWRDHIVPARRAHNFTFVSAWANRETSTFAWVISYPDAAEHAAAEQAYLDSPARKAAMPRDPRDFLEGTEIRFMESVEL